MTPRGGADRATVAAVTGSMLLMGWWLWRGRHRFEPLRETYDFDTSRNTRHMVEMHRRVDRDALREWLAAEEDAAGSLDGVGGKVPTSGAR